MAKFAFSIMDANNNHIPVTIESTSMVSARTLLGDSLSHAYPVDTPKE